MTTRRRVLLLLTGLALASCGAPALPAGPAVTPPSGGGGGKYQCRDMTGKTDPWLVEWDATQKARMQATSNKGALLVRYAGCELEVLYGCERAGGYELVPTTPASSTEYITSEDDVFAKLPIGALNLAAEFRQGDKWSLDYVIVGMRQSPIPSVAREELSGECATATHYISGMAVGAYQLVSEARRKASGGVTVGSAGAGAASGGAAGALRQDGKYEICTGDEAKADDPRCQAIVQLFLSPVTGAPAASGAGAASADEGPPAPVASGAGAASADEVQQPGTNLFWLRCPVGQTWSGALCTGEGKKMKWSVAKEACPAGYRLPTRQEYVSLLGGCDAPVQDGNLGVCSMCNKSATCVSMFPGDVGWYWSSSLNAFNGQFIWSADLSNGAVNFYSKIREKLVRCVRSEP